MLIPLKVHLSDLQRKKIQEKKECKKETNVVLKFNQVNVGNDYLYLNEKQMEKLKKNRAKGKRTLIRFSLEQMLMQLQPPPPPPPIPRAALLEKTDEKIIAENTIFQENFSELLDEEQNVNTKAVKISNLFIKNIKHGASAFPGGISDVVYAIRYWIPEKSKKLKSLINKNLPRFKEEFEKLEKLKNPEKKEKRKKNLKNLRKKKNLKLLNGITSLKNLKFW